MKSSTIERYEHSGLVIRTPDQKLRIFVSSTLKELAAERKSARKSIEKLHMAPVMFELGARPYIARDLYKAYLEQSHIFIGIYGEQYGWIGPGMEISGLEEEYQLAKDKTKLIYIKKSVANRDEKLTVMLKNIRDVDGISYKYYDNVSELEELISADLALLLGETFESYHQKDEFYNSEKRIHRIPAVSSSIIGREQEKEAVVRLMRSTGIRLLTFTGPGGSGKTRLSLEIAHTLKDDYHEIYYIELAAIHKADLTADAIAHSLNLREAGEKHSDQLIKEYIGDEQVLLILDNFEQIADDAAALISAILESCQKLKIIVTSRMALQIRGEIEYPVMPLAVPVLNNQTDLKHISHYPAVNLFCTRAKAIQPDFELNENNAKAVATICRSLDGLPLAIELVAARIRLFSPESIMKKLNKRLPFLTNGTKDLPERQQTMRHTIAWSYNLLEPTEMELFRQLAVFSGGANLEMIEVLCKDNKNCGINLLSDLEALIRKNLIIAQQDNTESTRLNMLETIREYALEQIESIGLQKNLFTSHADYFTRFVEETEPHLVTGKRNLWLAKLDLEIDNLRAVMERSLSGVIDAQYGIRMAGTLGWFWHLRGYLGEGQNWAISLLSKQEASTENRLHAKLLFPAGGLAWSRGDFKTTVRYLEESAAIFDRINDLRGLTDARAILAGGLAGTGRISEARILCEDTVKRLRAVGDEWGLAFTLFWLGSILIAESNKPEQSHELFEESYKIANELNDTWLHAESLSHLGMTWGQLRENDKAESCFEDSIVLHKSINDRFGTALCQSLYGDFAIDSGMPDKSSNLYTESIRVWHEFGNRPAISANLYGFARIAISRRESESTALMYGAIRKPVRLIGYLFLQNKNIIFERLIGQLKNDLDEYHWNKKVNEGKNLSLSEAVEYVIA